MQKTKGNPSLNKADLEKTRLAKVQSDQDQPKISRKRQRYRLSGNQSSLSSVRTQIIPIFAVAFCKHKTAGGSTVSSLLSHQTADHQHITLGRGQIEGQVRLEDGAQCWKVRVTHSNSRAGKEIPTCSAYIIVLHKRWTPLSQTVHLKNRG
jgi:hypothetical protein